MFRKITKYKIMLLTIIGSYLFSMVSLLPLQISSVSAITTTKTNTTTITNRMVSIDARSIISDGNTHTLGTDRYWADKKVQVETAYTPFVNMAEGIFPTDPIKSEIDPTTGNLVNIYYCQVPIELDFNIYTTQDINVFGSTATKINLPVVVGRVYQGHKWTEDGGLCTHKQVRGWASANFDVESVGRNPTNLMMPTIYDPNDSYKAGTAYCNINKVTDWFGNDGDEEFVSTKPVIEYNGFIGTMDVSGAPKTTFAGSDSSTGVQYVTYDDGSKYIIDKAATLGTGIFTTNFDINVHPDIGILQSSNFLTQDGQYNNTNTWVRIVGIALDSQDAHTGLVDTPISRDNFIKSPPSDVHLGATTPSSTTETSDTSPTTFTGKVFTGSNNAIYSVVGGTPENYQGIKVGAKAITTLASLADNSQVDTSTFVAKDPDSNRFNIVGYTAQIGGFELAPVVNVYKKTTSVTNKEAWYNSKTNTWYKEPLEKTMQPVSTVAGWDVLNTYAHERLIVTVEVYSEYQIAVSQGKDGSHLGDPQPRAAVPKYWLIDNGFETGDTGLAKAPVPWYNTLGDFFSSLGNSLNLGQLGGIIYAVVVIALIGVGIYIAYFIYSKIKIASNVAGFVNNQGNNYRNSPQVNQQTPYMNRNQPILFYQGRDGKFYQYN